MSKDPAFLFYSKDFYEGTRLMLPEERACYIDLMIYQHQNGFIPKDLRRVLMYCSGISEATLKATLEAKFKLCDKGWYNEKLKKISEDRKEFSSKQSDNGRVGQFFKTAKSELSAKKFKELKDFIYQDFGKEELLKVIKNKNTLKASLKALLKHLENGNAIANANKDKNIKGGSRGKSEIKLPWETETFKTQWQHWKIYKKKEFRFNFTSVQSEKSALTALFKKSNGNEKTAIKIIARSMAEGWKGLFELKENKNGSKSTTVNRQTAEVIKSNSEGW